MPIMPKIIAFSYAVSDDSLSNFSFFRHIKETMPNPNAKQRICPKIGSKGSMKDNNGFFG